MNPNQKNNKKMKVAVMGDIHAHTTSQGSFESVFAEISDQADILILCGDITNTGLPAEAEQLAHDLHVCRIPVLAVLGNHDHHSDKVNELKDVLKKQIVFLEDEKFVKDTVSFVGTKGFGGGFDSHMVAFFGEKATRDFVTAAVDESLRLENSLRTVTTPKCVVTLHYSPIVETVKDEPQEIFPFLGSSRLAEAIDRFPVSLVLHGHAHNGHYQGKTRNGVPVYNCCQELLLKKFKKPYTVFEI
jgi:Icc-related predicted phosphoesterase